MTTLEKIRAEQAELFKASGISNTFVCYEALKILDKYAEQKTDIEYIGEFCHKHGLVLISKEMADKYAEQEPTGYWITEDMFDGDVAYRCSECNELFWLESGTPKDNEYNFCPKCGKKLVEPKEREEL